MIIMGGALRFFMGFAQFIRADYESAKKINGFSIFSSHEFTGAIGCYFIVWKLIIYVKVKHLRQKLLKLHEHSVIE